MSHSHSFFPPANQATGFCSPAETEREAPLDLNQYVMAHPAASYFWRAARDWPEFGIRAGDILLVDRAWEPRHGLLALGLAQNQFCLGRLVQLASRREGAQGWRLQDTASQVEIWGVVCHVIRRLV